MSEKKNSYQESAPQSVSSDFFHGDIEKGLDRMRRRLLDLTKRNRLLNFKETRSSTLRVIDEVPDILYSKLIDGKEMSFGPVPKPRRVELFDPQGEQYDVKSVAERHGINTSYELSNARPESFKPSHTDNEIQTLLFPDRLEAVLSKTASDARLAIEETGTNMLYLAFGFLEWYDTDESGTPYLAPLFLLPATLRRGEADPTTGAFRYFISYSGEDILANISLEEKMKGDFRLELPPLSEEDTPESYFAKFGSILKSKAGWQVHRYVTLTLLSFGKLLMYRDLAPGNWPDGSEISSHPRIREFFEGVQMSEFQVATDYELDDPPQGVSVPPLIDNADSSQHSVIIDALAGKNLVVQGPPGTGKSQTITNLIASALVAGKSVLFVSEKLAALEVVRRRLDNAGLGMFCLELHSNKTRKDGLLNDISRRLELHKTFRNAPSLDDKMQLLEEQKQKLKTYAKAIGANFGKSGLSVHEIFWRRELLKSQCKIGDGIIEGITVPSCESFTRKKIERGRQLAENFARHYLEVSAHSSNVTNVPPGLDAHPWFGVTNPELTLADQRILVGLLGDLVSLIEQLTETVGRFASEISDENDAPVLFGDTPAEIAQIMAKLDKVFAIDLSGVESAAFVPLRQAGALDHVQSFAQNVQAYRQTHSDLAAIFQPVVELTIEEINNGYIAWKILAAHFSASETLAVAERVTQSIRGWTSDLEEAIAVFSEAKNLLGLDELADRVPNVIDFKSVLKMIDRCPFDLLDKRHTGLEIGDAVETIQRATSDRRRIKNMEAAIAERFSLSLCPDSDSLQLHIAACANAGWLRIFDREYKKAKTAYKTCLATPAKVSKGSMLADFQSMYEYQTLRSQFNENRRYAEVCGPYFNGVDSDFESQMSLATWLDEGRRSLDSVAVAPDLWLKVWSLPSASLRGYRGDKIARALTSIGSISELFKQVSGTLPGFIDEADLRSANQSKQKFAHEGNKIQGSLDFFRKRNFPKTLSISELDPVLARLTELTSLGKKVNDDPVVRQCFPASYKGVATDTERVFKTALAFAQIEESGLAPKLTTFLLSDQIEDRIRFVADVKNELARFRKRETTLLSKINALGRLDPIKWFRSAQSFDSTTLGISKRRAEEAISGKEALNSWIIYLQIRSEFSLDGGGTLVVEAVEGGSIPAHQAANVYEFGLFNSLLKKVFSKYPVVERFSGLTHSEVQSEFARLDQECLQLYRKRAAHTIDKREIPYGNSYGPVRTYSELALLIHEINKQRRHIPIRQLIHRAGRALMALKPCFMMGPLSVAQYLAPGNFKFDFVIMDEASQLKPEDSLGAIARGKQVVIVGDRKQLPPTSFFDRVNDEESEEVEDNLAQNLEDSESILDVANAVYQPARMLKWHYRSRHASLIAFSNKEFYDSKLVVFPSPTPTALGLGVRLQPVAEPLYADRRNVPEAVQIVNAVMSRIAREPNMSLGVVAMNSSQRDVLEEVFLRELKGRSDAEEYLESMRLRGEPFFVKNLENVQGDERDVILVSMTYGPNESGRILQRFGPINSLTGHRRLNVLFTRARCRVEVFSSMTSDDIIVGEKSSAGVRALKGYLEYARTGILEQAHFSGREPDSDFEVEVASAIKELGFAAVAQVGVAGFFVDIGVLHPDHEERFVIGIECDGASYHSGRSARDRDRLREEVLSDLGWRLHRIWSVDWYHNRSREIEKMREAIVKNLER